MMCKYTLIWPSSLISAWSVSLWHILAILLDYFLILWHKKIGPYGHIYHPLWLPVSRVPQLPWDMLSPWVLSLQPNADKVHPSYNFLLHRGELPATIPPFPLIWSHLLACKQSPISAVIPHSAPPCLALALATVLCVLPLSTHCRHPTLLCLPNDLKVELF